MSYLQTDLPDYKPQSSTPSSPPDTPSPKSPTHSEENLPIPYVHTAGMSQYTPATTPDSTTDWKQSPQYLSMEEKHSTGEGTAATLSLSDPGGARERTSPTRPSGLRDQQNQPNQFTPASYYGTPTDKDEAFATTLNGGGAHSRRQFANVTPTSYTTPTPYPLTRMPSGSGRAEGPAPKPGFYDSPAYWLILYFFFNLGLTLFNKIVLVSFPFPYVRLTSPTKRSRSPH